MGEPAEAQPFGVGLTNFVGVVTPTFHQLFNPGKSRAVFRRKLKPRVKPLVNISEETAAE